jgi:adenylate kinase
MQYGGLVGDDLIMAIVHERLASVDPTRGCVFDGIPRTLDQALMLDDLLRTRRERPLVVIELRLPDIYIPRRLKARRICSQCGTPGKVDPLVRICLECDGRLVSRDDDRPEIALARLRRYRVESEPMFKYYRRLGVLRTINAARVEQIVTARIEKHLDERLMDFYANRLPVSSRNDRRASG